MGGIRSYGAGVGNRPVTGARRRRAGGKDAAADRRRVAARDQTRRLLLIARKHGTRVKLYSRPGNDLTYRFTLIVESLARLRSRSCIIDGEAVCCATTTEW